jgi:hypothetical protein
VGIPTVKDRIVQTAALLVLEPIFEADFLDSSYGFRPGRNAHQAIDVIRQHLTTGFREIYDADLKSYFDTIPHDSLIKCLERRIADRSVLKLIRMWLESPIVETDDRGKTQVTRPKQGTPQGGVISPLLANLYLHWFEKQFYRADGPGRWANAKLVRYADDFVVLARYQTRRLINWIEGLLEGRFRLTVNRRFSRGGYELTLPSTKTLFSARLARSDVSRFSRFASQLFYRTSRDRDAFSPCSKAPSVVGVGLGLLFWYGFWQEVGTENHLTLEGSVMDDKRCRRFFLDADSATYHRQYEALRAIFIDGLAQNDVAVKYGYTNGSMRQLVHGFRRAIRSDSPPPFFRSPRTVGHRTAVPTARPVRQHRL